METKLLTVDEVASILRCSTRHVYNLVHSTKNLPSIKVGKRYLIPSDALAEWVRENTTVEV